MRQNRLAVGLSAWVCFLGLGLGVNPAIAQVPVVDTTPNGDINGWQGVIFSAINNSLVGFDLPNYISNGLYDKDNNVPWLKKFDDDFVQQVRFYANRLAVDSYVSGGSITNWSRGGDINVTGGSISNWSRGGYVNISGGQVGVTGVVSVAGTTSISGGTVGISNATWMTETNANGIFRSLGTSVGRSVFHRANSKSFFDDDSMTGAFLDGTSTTPYSVFKDIYSTSAFINRASGLSVFKDERSKSIFGDDLNKSVFKGADTLSYFGNSSRQSYFQGFNGLSVFSDTNRVSLLQDYQGRSALRDDSGRSVFHTVPRPNHLVRVSPFLDGDGASTETYDPKYGTFDHSVFKDALGESVFVSTNGISYLSYLGMDKTNDLPLTAVTNFDSVAYRRDTSNQMVLAGSTGDVFSAEVSAPPTSIFSEFVGFLTNSIPRFAAKTNYVVCADLGPVFHNSSLSIDLGQELFKLCRFALCVVLWIGCGFAIFRTVLNREVANA